MKNTTPETTVSAVLNQRHHFVDSISTKDSLSTSALVGFFFMTTTLVSVHFEISLNLVPFGQVTVESVTVVLPPFFAVVFAVMVHLLKSSLPSLIALGQVIVEVADVVSPFAGPVQVTVYDSVQVVSPVLNLSDSVQTGALAALSLRVVFIAVPMAAVLVNVLKALACSSPSNSSGSTSSRKSSAFLML